MIRSFRHKGLERFHVDADGRRLPHDLLSKIRLILTTMSSASNLDDLDLPGFRLHRLKGDRLDQWSVTVRANWRIVFEYSPDGFQHVDFIDYH